MLARMTALISDRTGIGSLLADVVSADMSTYCIVQVLRTTGTVHVHTGTGRHYRYLARQLLDLSIGEARRWLYRYRTHAHTHCIFWFSRLEDVAILMACIIGHFY